MDERTVEHRAVSRASPLTTPVGSAYAPRTQRRSRRLDPQASAKREPPDALTPERPDSSPSASAPRADTQPKDKADQARQADRETDLVPETTQGPDPLSGSGP
ncbi:hypothetical protein GCM10023336_29620 [Streptomyces similanensis]|uniref:Uncharacterized protein n=1 Tax=Streptomyces similanensis TaxID=1274988 RepID=A0ABP9KGB2_9ACTN